MNIRDEVFTVILTFFNGDGESAEHWMKTPNPLLGGGIPDIMIELGNGKRLLEGLQAQLPKKKGSE